MSFEVLVMESVSLVCFWINDCRRILWEICVSFVSIFVFFPTIFSTLRGWLPDALSPLPYVKGTLPTKPLLSISSLTLSCYWIFNLLLSHHFLYFKESFAWCPFSSAFYQRHPPSSNLLSPFHESFTLSHYSLFKLSHCQDFNISFRKVKYLCLMLGLKPALYYVIYSYKCLFWREKDECYKPAQMCICEKERPIISLLRNIENRLPVAHPFRRQACSSKLVR